MLFESTSLLLRNLVLDLERGDESLWDDHLQSCIQCIYELHQMSRSPWLRTHRADSKRSHAAPSSNSALLAIPHVKLMNAAIRRKDRQAAVEAGRTALAELDDPTHIRPVEADAEKEPAATENPTVPEVPIVIVLPTRRPAKQNVRAAGKRKPSRLLTAGPR